MLPTYAKIFFNQRGLNLFAVLDCGNLPVDIQEQLAAEHLDAMVYPRLVLLGTSGSRVWDLLQPSWMQRANPFDEYSTAVAEQFITEYLDDAPSRLFYPGPARISLMRLGELAGWSHPSPLGLGINPEYGLWFAYRAAFVTSADLPTTSPLDSPHPCHTCVDKPCISACPANAVSAEESFAISTCYNYRIAPSSPCAARCLSRLACPIGRQHQYSTEQMQHHYDLKRRVQ